MTTAQKIEFTLISSAKQEPGSAFSSSPDIAYFKHPPSGNTSRLVNKVRCGDYAAVKTLLHPPTHQLSMLIDVAESV
jgi:hypothetical protein